MICFARSWNVLPSSVNDKLRVVRRTSLVPTTRSSSARRSLTTDFDNAKRRAAPVMEPASAMAEKAAMDSSLSIVRFFRILDRLIIGYRSFRLETIVRATIDR
jgi:hypothetical protein